MTLRIVPRATLFLNDVGVGGLDDQNTFCVHSRRDGAARATTLKDVVAGDVCHHHRHPRGEKGKGARHENTSVIKMTLSCFLTKHTAAAPTLSSRTQTSRAVASLSPSCRKL